MNLPSSISIYTDIIIASAAVLALFQIKVAKNIAEENSKRESVKLAFEMVKFYLNDYLDINTKVYLYKKAESIEVIKLPTEATNFYLEEFVEAGHVAEVRSAFEQYKYILDKHSELHILLLKEANILEIFATPFVTGVADDSVGFDAVGRTFCDSMERKWFHFSMIRDGKMGENNYYKNSTSLYKKWNKRIKKHQLLLSKEEIEKKIATFN